MFFFLVVGGILRFVWRRFCVYYIVLMYTDLCFLVGLFMDMLDKVYKEKIEEGKVMIKDILSTYILCLFYNLVFIVIF